MATATRWPFAVALFLAVWFGGAGNPARAQSTDYCAIHGVVLNYDGTPLPGGEVELTSREEDFTAAVGADGRFNLYARPGLYSLKVTRPDILPYQRAQIVVRAGGIVNLNVRPVFKDPDPGLHYYSFVVPGQIELGAVTRRIDQKRPEPRGSFGQDYDMLSFDSLSVYAQSLACDRRTLNCSAEGDVRIEIGDENGVRQERAEQVEIDLVKRRIHLYGRDTTEIVPF